MVVSKNKEMRTWSGQNTHRVVRCRSSAKSPSPIIDMLLNRKSLPEKKNKEIKTWRWTERDLSLFIKRMPQGGDDLCHVQQAAHARQTSCTCKANRSHLQGRPVACAMRKWVHACFMIQSLVKVVPMFINCKMRFPWLLFVVYHSVIFLTEKLLKF